MKIILLLILFTNLLISADGDGEKISTAAFSQIGVTKSYNPKYVSLEYPNGDVDRSTGVCADVIVRSLREIGVDLQKEIHEDMVKHFDQYPAKWGLSKPDSNIDHRRVLNLMTYFNRNNKSVKNGTYMPGDIIAWDLGHGLTHIGIISKNKVPDQNRYLMIHNIGSGTKEEDILLEYKMIGHYRW